MIRSMTGFGSAAATADGLDLSLELRSVNSRHLKVNFRLPPGTERWEEVLREEVASRVRRGHVDVTLRTGLQGGEDSGAGSAPVFRLDEARARAYVEALRELKDRWELAGEVDIGLIGRCDRVLVEAASDPMEAVSEDTLRELAAEAATQLVEMRLREGERLAVDLLARVTAMESSLAEIEDLAPLRLERETERLRRSIRELAGDIEIEPDRLAREIAFIADKWGISEELVRARAHLEAFRALVDEPAEEPVGKRLSFLGQEILREVNTIGSKANDAAIARIVVDMKNEVESLREQNENVE
jgi:uncharacterized protein (TIGR00255 family)